MDIYIICVISLTHSLQSLAASDAQAPQGIQPLNINIDQFMQSFTISPVMGGGGRTEMPATASELQPGAYENLIAAMEALPTVEASEQRLHQERDMLKMLQDKTERLHKEQVQLALEIQDQKEAQQQQQQKKEAKQHHKKVKKHKSRTAVHQLTEKLSEARHLSEAKQQMADILQNKTIEAAKQKHNKRHKVIHPILLMTNEEPQKIVPIVHAEKKKLKPKYTTLDHAPDLLETFLSKLSNTQLQSLFNGDKLNEEKAEKFLKKLNLIPKTPLDEIFTDVSASDSDDQGQNRPRMRNGEDDADQDLNFDLDGQGLRMDFEFINKDQLN